MSFNGRHDHHGTMFEGRYHERNHKPEPEVMWRTSAYIDINAWEFSGPFIRSSASGPR